MFTTTPGQLIELIRQKLGLSHTGRHVRSEEAKLVRSLISPRTAEQRQQLLNERPLAWEYILWASVMWEGKEDLEDKWRDHELRLPKPSSAILNADTLRQFADEVLDELEAFARRLNSMFATDSQEALGKPGEPGDPVEIDHYARRIVSLYENLIDWAAQLRGTKARPEYARLAEIAAQLADLPLQAMRSFFDDFVREISALPARVEAGEPATFHITLKLDIDNSVIDAFLREYERVM